MVAEVDFERDGEQKIRENLIRGAYSDKNAIEAQLWLIKKDGERNKIEKTAEEARKRKAALNDDIRTVIGALTLLGVFINIIIALYKN